jgi:GNAT superfamily N-acetyltransferase
MKNNKLMLEILPLTPARLPDYLAFFDREAFIDNPDWAGCYCYFYLASEADGPWPERSGQQNRQAISQCILQGRLHGYLAYLEGAVAGWCHAAPLAQIPNLYDPQDPLADQTGVILCFVIAPPYRGQGIASQILQVALEGFRTQGLTYAEAHPHPDSQAQSSNYHGPLSMYLSAGFEVVGKQQYLLVARKRL